MVELSARYFYKGANVKNYPVTPDSGQETELYREVLKQKCTESNRKLNILEIGCGTGLYFSCLSNISKLVGIDVSKEMIARAKANLDEHLGHLKDVTTLVSTGIEDFETNEKFDFIYSIGTLGEYCAFDDKLFNKLVSLLARGGFLFFTIVDSESYRQVKITNKKMLLARYLFRFIPGFIKHRIGYKFIVSSDFSYLFMSRQQVLNILERYNGTLKWELTIAKDKKHVHHICKVSML